jgi:exodeoxyribonuclease VII small subunit
MNDVRQEDQSFESLLGQFDEIVTALETNDLSLEEAIEMYERAAELAALCAQLLNQAELRIRRIDEGLARLDETDEWDDTDEH